MFFPSLSTLFITILVVTAFYYAVLGFRWFRALGTMRLGKSIQEPLPSVSVLIAARNLAQYAAQYPDKFHIIAIKDLPEGQSAKKNAISLMVATSESEILRLTDTSLHLQKIAAHYPWKARYGVHEKTFVKTTGKETLKGLWEQRKRWASKTIDDSPRFVFLLFMVFFLALCIVGTLSFFSYKILIATLLVFALKVIGDMLLIVRGLHIFNQQQLLKWFLPIEFFQAPFIVLSVLLGTAGKFQWKP
ncbi:MAG: hypothetical protein WCX75_02200 [Fibrobacteraceae bacterium]